jgi:NAD(P)-dependent dehydrogenase (short-subunit alcohol dehydrogenase family)
MKVLITGANSGFGLLTAQTFARAGHQVFAGYRSPERSTELLQMGQNGELTPVRLDVDDQASVDAAVAAASEGGAVDILVNNAGYEVAGPVEQVSPEDLRRQFETNVVGPLRLIRAVVPAMRERGSGVIVNITSTAGIVTLPFAGAYGASKHALEALSESLWYELQPFGVRVAIVEPGGFDTNFGANIARVTGFDESSPYWENANRFGQALANLGGASAGNDPQQVADAVFVAATTTEPQLRYPVGGDAEVFLPLYRQHSFEQFSSTGLSQLGLSDWLGKASA